jgi:hypothetical protein
MLDFFITYLYAMIDQAMGHDGRKFKKAIE